MAGPEASAAPGACLGSHGAAVIELLRDAHGLLGPVHFRPGLDADVLTIYVFRLTALWGVRETRLSRSFCSSP